MNGRRIQFGLWSLHVAVALVAVALGAVLGGPVRAAIIAASIVFALAMLACMIGIAWLFLIEGGATAWEWLCWLVRLPMLARQRLFERKLARLRRGNPSDRVRRLLGSPRRVDGFGDRLYWSYSIAGERYMVSLDPRRFVHTYSSRLRREVHLQGTGRRPGNWSRARV